MPNPPLRDRRRQFCHLRTRPASSSSHPPSRSSWRRPLTHCSALPSAPVHPRCRSPPAARSHCPASNPLPRLARTVPHSLPAPDRPVSARCFCQGSARPGTSNRNGTSPQSLRPRHDMGALLASLSPVPRLAADRRFAGRPPSPCTG